MQLLIDYAKSEGLKRIYRDVLQDNIIMLAMCRELGFEVETRADEPSCATSRCRWSERTARSA